MPKPIAIKPGKFGPTPPPPVAGTKPPSKFGPVPGAKVKTVTAPVDDQPVSTSRTTVRKPKPEPAPVVEETAPMAEEFLSEGALLPEDAPATEEAPYDAAWEQEVLNGEAVATEEEPVYEGSLPPGEEPAPEEQAPVDEQTEGAPARAGRQPRRNVGNTPAAVGSILLESISIEIARLQKVVKLANSDETMQETLAALFASDNAVKVLSLVAEDPKILTTLKKFYNESTAGLPVPAAATPRAAAPRTPRQGGLLDKVVEYVTAQGSATRQQILTGTGLAGGSFAHTVKGSGKFVQNQDKTWSVAG